MKQSFKKYLVTIFIIANLMMMIRAQLDQKSPVINYVYTPITFIQNYFSMWRGWSMFAPEPMRMNAYIDAIVTFEDETEYVYNFLNIEDESLYERYIYGERLRKYMTDGLRLDSKSYLWKDAAKFVLKKIATTHFKKKPVSVTLRRRWQPLTHWDLELVPHRTKVDKKVFNKYEYYTYEVNP